MMRVEILSRFSTIHSQSNCIISGITQWSKITQWAMSITKSSLMELEPQWNNTLRWWITTTTTWTWSCGQMSRLIMSETLATYSQPKMSKWEKIPFNSILPLTKMISHILETGIFKETCLSFSKGSLVLLLDLHIFWARYLEQTRERISTNFSIYPKNSRINIYYSFTSFSSTFFSENLFPPKFQKKKNVNLAFYRSTKPSSKIKLLIHFKSEISCKK